MRTLRYTDPGYRQSLAEAVAASSLFDPVVEDRTRAIIESVRTRGDAALVELTQRFDGAELSADRLAVTQAEFLQASLEAHPELRRAAELAARNISSFSRRSLRKPWRGRNRQGGYVGEKYDPFQRVGIYIPGGTAPLVSTALMTVTLARAAGCAEIVVCSPPGRDGRLHPGLLFAVRHAGATEVYRLGGAQAIAAMALGTGTVRRVQKVFGPGNAYVVAAKRLLFGHVSIDLLPGPSEVLVLADESANPRFAAADMLAQAEHGSGHERVWLVTPSSKVLKAVTSELDRQLPTLARQSFVRRALEANGCLVLSRSLDEAVDITNQFAPEHCEILTRNPERIASRLHTAGALFLGNQSPTVLGDYVAGPSHELPTGGAGACFAGLTADQFQRRTSIVRYDRTALQKSIEAIRVFAEAEGLDAHRRSAEIRLTR